MSYVSIIVFNYDYRVHVTTHIQIDNTKLLIGKGDFRGEMLALEKALELK